MKWWGWLVALSAIGVWGCTHRAPTTVPEPPGIYLLPAAALDADRFCVAHTLAQPGMVPPMRCLSVGEIRMLVWGWRAANAP
jgi:hypothetical protein